MYKYQNVSEGSPQVIVGVGTVQPGQEFLSRTKIENPNIKFIEEIEEPDEDRKVSGVEGRQSGAVTEASLVEEGDK